MKDESQESLSRVLDEIAEVTRNNNVMNATETNNPNNFKMFVHEPVAISIKSENDRYLLEGTDDENLFDCQVELTEETDSFVETENAKPLDESDQSLGEEQSAEMPKIHLKTVDEINRKCIVTSYIDTAKRRRQEVNRRYYLKRKQQQLVEKKSENQMENKEVEKVEKLEVPVYHHLQVEERERMVETETETQDYNYPQYTEDTYPLEYPQEFCTGWTQESYENHTKKIRQEINRRYYLKRKKKKQEEEGIEERVIIKNEAYFRRRERNRRYYLKKKQREKGEDQGDDSSNSSFQFNYSLLSDDRNEMFGSQFGQKFQGMSEHSDYTCTSNEMTQEIKSESSSSANNYAEGVNNQAVQGWVDSQTTYNQDYEIEDRTYEQLPHFISSNSSTTKQSLEEYLNEAARKRQERNRRYYLKHKEKLKQQRLQKGKNDSVTAQTEVM